MSLVSQQALVDEWSVRATSARAQRIAHRAAIHDWKQKRFATPGMLVWAFAAGAWWGTGRALDPRKAKAAKKYVGLANTLLLAWRLLGTRS